MQSYHLQSYDQFIYLQTHNQLIKIYLISILITAVVLQSVFMIKCEHSAILKSENNWNGCLWTGLLICDTLKISCNITLQNCNLKALPWHMLVQCYKESYNNSFKFYLIRGRSHIFLRRFSGNFFFRKKYNFDYIFYFRNRKDSRKYNYF